MTRGIVTRMDNDLYEDVRTIKEKYRLQTLTEAQRKASILLRWRQPELDDLVRELKVRGTKKP